MSLSGNLLSSEVRVVRLVPRRISLNFLVPVWTVFPSCDFLLDDDWQEAHERLAELEEKLPAAVNEQTGNGERDEMDLLGDHEENLAERLSKMVIENELEDPAIMRAVQTRPVLQVSMLLWFENYSRLVIEVKYWALPFCFLPRDFLYRRKLVI